MLYLLNQELASNKKNQKWIIDSNTIISTTNSNNYK